MKIEKRMRNRIIFMFALLGAMVLTGCGTEQRYLYVEDAPHDTPMPITNNYDATIYPNDQLYIYVGSQSPSTV